MGLIQFGGSLGYELDSLKEPIRERFPFFHTQLQQPLLETFEAYVSQRHQYHSTRILVMLEEHVRRLGPDRLLGVTEYDLFIPGHNFVFGEARLPGRVGIVSTSRLHSSQAALSDLFHQRMIKETIHELGHMVGLNHCPDLSCVMHQSNSLSDTDLKSPDFCTTCQSTLPKESN